MARLLVIRDIREFQVLGGGSLPSARGFVSPEKHGDHYIYTVSGKKSEKLPKSLLKKQALLLYDPRLDELNVLPYEEFGVTHADLTSALGMTSEEYDKVIRPMFTGKSFHMNTRSAGFPDAGLPSNISYSAADALAAKRIRPLANALIKAGYDPETVFNWSTIRGKTAKTVLGDWSIRHSQILSAVILFNDSFDGDLEWREDIVHTEQDPGQELGGPGSGNWGHKGTPGKRGGSMKKGKGFIPPKIYEISRKQPRVVAARDTVKVLRTSKILPKGPWFTPMEKGFIPPRKVAPIDQPTPLPAPTGRQVAERRRSIMGYIIGEGSTAQKVIVSDEQPTFSERAQITHTEGSVLNPKASLESLLTNEVKTKLNEEYGTRDWDDLFEEIKERPDDVLALVLGAALQVREAE